jgi:hypothetical protein
MESVIVGIFENAQDLDRADKELAAAGFEGHVYDEAVLADLSCDVSPVSVGPLLAPGVAPTDNPGGVEVGLPASQAFRSQLADYRLPDEVIDAYVGAFSHQGRFIVVRTEPECAKHITKILEECRASRVNQHDLDTMA